MVMSDRAIELPLVHECIELTVYWQSCDIAVNTRSAVRDRNKFEVRPTSLIKPRGSIIIE